jgi:hypothetical protein
MRLQTGVRQDEHNGRIVNRADDRLFHHHLLETVALPLRQVQAISRRVGAGDALDVDALQWGKTGNRPLRSASKMASTPYCYSNPTK